MRIGKQTVLKLFLAGICVAGTAGFLTYYRSTSESAIIEFDTQRDAQEILAIFDRDWDWLIPGGRETFSPEFMLTYRAPMQNIAYAGHLKIKVIRKEGKLIGFVAWYMKSQTVGCLNFVAVNPEYRGQGYAEKLLRYAMDAMIAHGAQKLTMVTWPHNVRARKLYDRVGWKVVKEAYQVHYEYIVPGNH